MNYLLFISIIIKSVFCKDYNRYLFTWESTSSVLELVIARNHICNASHQRAKDCSR